MTHAHAARQDSRDAAYAAYDAALAWLAPWGPDLAWGFTSHAPMVVEALCALGRGDAALPWLEAHREGLLPRPAPTAPIDPRRWSAALGRPERFADWAAHFERELRDAPPARVVARWVPRLLPGLAAAAAHGVIRTAHACRALSRGDTPLRRGELASALGYWAATWQRLPATAQPSRAPTGAARALEHVPRIAATRPPCASIVGAFLALDDCPAFAPVLHDFDVMRPLDEAIGDLTRTFARVFVANATDRLSAVVFTHGITAAESLRTLAGYLAPGDARDALRFAWQTGAALVATWATAGPAPEDTRATDPSSDAWVRDAIAGGDDHAIKLVCACLSEHAREPSPVLLAAAERGVRLLEP